MPLSHLGNSAKPIQAIRLSPFQAILPRQREPIDFWDWMRAPDCAGQRAGLNEIEMKTETETETDERRIEAKDQGFLEE